MSKGAQVGALAVTAEGAYVQVVGDHQVPLKTKEIAKAVANAPKEPSAELSREIPSWRASRKEAPAPVVIPTYAVNTGGFGAAGVPIGFVIIGTGALGLLGLLLSFLRNR